MKLIPGKYLNEDFLPEEDFVLPIWDYIEINLQIFNLDKSYLEDLFDISSTTLSNWKKSTRNISQDKLVVLANLFRVTIDQLMNREFNSVSFDEYTYGIRQSIKSGDYKKLKYWDLENLYREISMAPLKIEYLPLGYIPANNHPKDPYPAPDEIIEEDNIRYLCSLLDIDVCYDTKDGGWHSEMSISSQTAFRIASELYTDWGNDAPNHIFATIGKNYDYIMLLSENREYLEEAFVCTKNVLNHRLLLWMDLKEKHQDFDKDNIIAKLLLDKGAMIVTNHEPSVEATYNFMKELIVHDLKMNKQTNKEEK